MSNLLITGGAGFIGANFTHYWLAQHPGDHIVVLDALTYAGNPASLAASLRNPRLTFVHGDIRTPRLAEGLLREHAISRLVHFAAESHVDRSITGPDPFLETNVLGTHELLKAARRVWLEEGNAAPDCCFHHISTDEVYGSLGSGDPPAREGSAYAPSSPYSASKAASDHLVRAYHRTYGLPVITTTSSNNYGPYQFPEKLIPLMLVNLLEGKPLPIYGDGLHIRDWLYVEDHCRAIDRVIEAGRVGETYNVGGGNQWTNIDVARLLCALVDQQFTRDNTLATRFPRSPMASERPSDELIISVQDRPGHDRRYAMNTVKITRDLGYAPLEDFESGLRKTVEWYLANEPWWRAVKEGGHKSSMAPLRPGL